MEHQEAALPVRRDIKFDLDSEKAMNWNEENPFGALFLNAWSITFPRGERTFIEAVRAHRDHESIKSNKVLTETIRAFIGQEALHSREHEGYNKYIEEKAPKTFKFIEGMTETLFSFYKVCSDKTKMLSTVAIEHLTAITSEFTLENSWHLGPEDQYKALWMWHSLEETEHKAVAFDVYQTVYGDDSNLGSYLLRCFALAIMTFGFYSIVFIGFLALVIQQGKFFRLDLWFKFFKTYVFKAGIKTTMPWLDWFRRGFHPWQHDNIKKLKEFEEYLGGQPSPFVMNPPSAPSAA